jgi:hypothetical protein
MKKRRQGLIGLKLTAGVFLVFMTISLCSAKFNPKVVKAAWRARATGQLALDVVSRRIFGEFVELFNSMFLALAAPCARTVREPAGATSLEMHTTCRVQAGRSRAIKSFRSADELSVGWNLIP